MMIYLKNRGNLYYQVISYDKKADSMKLLDPHTEETFTISEVKLLIELGKFKLVKRA